ncbi:hypothetical protein FRC02_002522, partial [Tulasnella sp. 418]
DIVQQAPEITKTIEVGDFIIQAPSAHSPVDDNQKIQDNETALQDICTLVEQIIDTVVIPAVEQGMEGRFSTTLQVLTDGLRGVVSKYMHASGTASRHAVLKDIVHTDFLQSLDLTLRKSLEHLQFHTKTGSGRAGDEADRYLNEDIREVVQHIEKRAIAIEQNISSTNTMLFDNSISQGNPKGSIACIC